MTEKNDIGLHQNGPLTHTEKMVSGSRPGLTVAVLTAIIFALFIWVSFLIWGAAKSLLAIT